MKYTGLTKSVALALCCLQACNSRPAPDKNNSSASASAPRAQSETGGFRYPAARWRLATFPELDRTTLWLGHIAIRYDKAQTISFRDAFWRPDPPNPKRSLAEASALAEKLAAAATAAPDTFEQLARQYSEDIVTREDGGMLGGVRASQLTGSDFLDVLAILKPGEVSKAFRTPYGFHILKRYPPPREETVAGERIVIGYQGVFGMTTENTRSRDEALQLAMKVVGEAKKVPSDFETLVENYSDNFDRTAHGDMGVFSTLDPDYYPREVHRLAQLEIGEVTGPMDSHFGFEILKRVPATPHKEYAMTVISLPFERRPDLREASMAKALKQAETVSRELKHQPERFEALQAKYCCKEIKRWPERRGDPDFSRVLDALSPGEIAEKPLLVGSAYWVIRRLDPSTLPPQKPRLTELPNPSAPDFEALLEFNNGHQIAGAARDLAEDIKKRAAFSPEVIQRIGAILGNLAETVEKNADDAAAVKANVYSTLATLENKLTAEQFSGFQTFGRQWAVRIMMPPVSWNDNGFGG
jgi:hypothetical protein